MFKQDTNRESDMRGKLYDRVQLPDRAAPKPQPAAPVKPAKEAK